jgi:hypothetical protein
VGSIQVGETASDDLLSVLTCIFVHHGDTAGAACSSKDEVQAGTTHTHTSWVCGRAAQPCTSAPSAGPTHFHRSRGSGCRRQMSLDDMEANERQGEDSIVQVYAALMLTMLVAQNPAGRRQLNSALPAAGVRQLTEVVERFLNFDEQVGTCIQPGCE